MKKSIIFLFFYFSIFQTFAQGLTASDFAGDFTKPVGFVCDPNGNFLVWEQTGKVWLVSKEGVKSASPLLDISAEVYNIGQLGLIGLVLHPQYLSNGYIYLSYLVDIGWETNNSYIPSGNGLNDNPVHGYPTCSFVRVTRYTVSTPSTTPTINLASRSIILSPTRFGAPVNTAFSHSGGGMAFGSDNTLLIALGCGTRDSDDVNGDIGGGSWSDWSNAINYGIMTSGDNTGVFRVFDKNNYSGKILRVNPITGAGVPSNPFYSAANPNNALSKFWAYGFRNPVRMTFLEDDSGSHHEMDGNPGKFIVSEVGSDKFEELNLLSGSNQFFGWPKYEGISHTHTWGTLGSVTISDTIIKPLIEYRNSIGRSVDKNGMMFNVPGLPIVAGSSNLGGFRYLKEDLPEEYHNDLFFADWESKNIYHMDLDSALNVTSIGTFYQAADKLGYIDVNPHLDGIFYISGCGEPSGKLRRIVWEDNSIRIRAKITASHDSGFSPNMVNFDSESTTYNGTGELSYLWNFGDGTISTQKNVAHIFSDSTIKNYKVKLTVTDDASIISSDSIAFFLNTMAPEILSTSIESLYSVSENADTTVNLSFTSNIMVPDENVEWRLSLCHDGHEHVHASRTGNNQSIVIPATMCAQGSATYWYKIYLEVKNSYNLSNTKVQNIYFNCVSGASQAITFNEIPQQNYGITHLPLAATSSSGLPIEYFISKGKASIQGNMIVFSPGAIGEIRVIATQKGGSGFKQAVPIERAFVIKRNPCGQYFSNISNTFKSYNLSQSSTEIVNFPVLNDKHTFSLKSIELLPGFEVKPESGFVQFLAEECPYD